MLKEFAWILPRLKSGQGFDSYIRGTHKQARLVDGVELGDHIHNFSFEQMVMNIRVMKNAVKEGRGDVVYSHGGTRESHFATDKPSYFNEL